MQIWQALAKWAKSELHLNSNAKRKRKTLLEKKYHSIWPMSTLLRCNWAKPLGLRCTGPEPLTRLAHGQSVQNLKKVGDKLPPAGIELTPHCTAQALATTRSTAMFSSDNQRTARYNIRQR